MSVEAHMAAAKLPPASVDRSLAGGYRWRLLAVMWFVVAVVVALPSVGGGVLNAHMIAELQFDRGVYGMSFGLFVIMMGVPGPLVACLVRRFGVKPVMMGGCALVIVGALLISTVVREGWQFAAAFGLLVGGGVAAAGVLPAQAAVTHWFVDRRALAVSIVLSAIDVGGIVAAPALQWVVGAHDWRAGWRLIAALGGVGLVAIAFLLRSEGGYGVGTPALTERPVSGRVYKSDRAWTFAEALRTRTFWCIAFFTVAVGMNWIFFMAHGVIHLRDLGFEPGQAAQAVAVMVTASLAGNVTAGALGDRVPPARIGAVTMVLMLAGVLLAVRPAGTAGLLAFALPVGFAYGASQVCLMAMLANYFGSKAFPALFGALLAGGTLVAAVLAGVAGAVFERDGAYTPIFHLCAAVTALAIVSIALATPPRNGPSAR
jgi:MFS family permease